MLPDLSYQNANPLEVMVGYNPSVAALGDDFLVVVENSPSYYQYRDIYAQRIAGEGASLKGARIGLIGGFAWNNTVGTVGNRWLVAWEGHYSHNDTQYTLTAAWVNADGSHGSPFGLFWGVGWSTSGVDIASYPQLGALVCSTTRAPSASNGEIYLLRVREDGTLLDGASGRLVTGNAPGEQYAPDVTWNGTEFVVAFQDDRASPPFQSFPLSDVYASRVSSDGVVLDDVGGFPVEVGPTVEWQPSVAGHDGAALVAFGTMQGGEFGALRVGLQVLTPVVPPLGPISGLLFADKAMLSWNGVETALYYDVLRGDLAALAVNGSVRDAACLGDDLPQTSHSDPSTPTAGTGFYYLVRADRHSGPPGSYDDPAAAGQVHGRDDDVGVAGCTHLP